MGKGHLYTVRNFFKCFVSEFDQGMENHRTMIKFLQQSLHLEPKSVPFLFEPGRDQQVLHQQLPASELLES